MEICKTGFRKICFSDFGYPTLHTHFFYFLHNFFISFLWLFQKMDQNRDGVVSMEEFLVSCTKDETITRSICVFDSVIWKKLRYLLRAHTVLHVHSGSGCTLCSRNIFKTPDYSKLDKGAKERSIHTYTNLIYLYMEYLVQNNNSYLWWWWWAK